MQFPWKVSQFFSDEDIKDEDEASDKDDDNNKEDDSDEYYQVRLFHYHRVYCKKS